MAKRRRLWNSACVADDDQPSGSLSDNALERRVKRWLASGPFPCFVQVTPGLESILVQELLELGLVPERDALAVVRGGVGLELDHGGIMRANLELRTAGRVLLRLGSFPAANREMLYDRARKIAWEVQLGRASGYRLRVSSKSSKLPAGDEVSNTVASAVSRHMREFGLFPKPADDAPLEFHVRLLDDRCTISLNTSGEHLHRRGLRTHVHTAPVRETLAAAMARVGLAGEPEPDLIVDPFCGSGTLLLEAADQLAGLAPGRQRDFAFQHAAWFRGGRWREVQRQSLAERVEIPGKHRLLGLDNDPEALDAARANLTAAGHLGKEAVGSGGQAGSLVELELADSTAFNFGALGVRSGLVLSNLPYGVRLGDRRQAGALASRFLDRLAASVTNGSGAATSWRLVLMVHDAAPITEHQAFETEATLATTNGGVPVVMVSGRVGRP